MNAAYAVILVDSTSQAMRIEKLVRNRGLTCKLIPLPRHLSSDCGVCLRILKADRETIRTILEENKIEINAIEVL